MNVKVLYCASITSHPLNFRLSQIQWLSENGCEVTTLADDGQALMISARSEKVKFTKRLWSLQNVKAISDVRRTLAKEKFALVVTNTTLASTVVKAAVMSPLKPIRSKVLYVVATVFV